MIAPSVVDTVRERADILGIIGRHVTLRKEGAEHVGLCPFHEERTPSFKVNPNKGFFKCFGCGAHGDAFGFLMRRDGISYPDAIRSIASDLGVNVDAGSAVPAEVIAQQREERQRRARELEAQAEAEAKEKALRLWRAASIASADNDYLRRKCVSPVGALREVPRQLACEILGYTPRANGNELVGPTLLTTPIKRGGELSSIELIDGEGRKACIAGGKVGGGHWAAQPLPQGDGEGITICIGEGVATMLSCREATGHVVIAARSCDNLEAVAREFRGRYPKARIVIVADLGNGQAKAEAAALAIGGVVAAPRFAEPRQPGDKDMNDRHRRDGLEAVRADIDAAKTPDVPMPHPLPENRSGAILARPDGVVTLRGDAVKVVALGWYWLGFLPSGKVVLIGGASGTGKTTLAIELAATITRGGRWPDGTRAEVGSVLVWSGEDSIADVLAPRFMAAEADMARVHFVAGVDTERGKRPFDPAQDFGRLAETAKAIPDLRLVIVDPIVMAVAGDSHKNAETRRGLQPLVDFAEHHGVVVVGVTHFSKGTQGRDPIERITGSLAFAAVARLVLVAAKLDESNGGGRVLVRSKSNLGPDGGGFNYELEQVEAKPGIQASRIRWGVPIEGAARDILAAAEVPGDPTEREEVRGAEEWLRDTLAEGSMPKAVVMDRGKTAGYSERTLQRARERIHAKAVVTGFGKNKRSLWALGTDGAIRASEPSIVPIVPNNNGGMNGTNGGTDGDSGDRVVL